MNKFLFTQNTTRWLVYFVRKDTYSEVSNDHSTFNVPLYTTNLLRYTYNIFIHAYILRMASMAIGESARSNDIIVWSKLTCVLAELQTCVQMFSFDRFLNSGKQQALNSKVIVDQYIIKVLFSYTLVHVYIVIFFQAVTVAKGQFYHSEYSFCF